MSRSLKILLLSLALAAVVAACVTGWTPPDRSYHRTAAVLGAHPVGAGECSDCHDEVEGWAPIPSYHADCEACHGGGSLHAESEDVADIRFPTSRDCLSCHETGRTTHLAYATGDHKRAGVICNDCHNPHNREPYSVRKVRQAAFPRMDPYSSLCASCHADVASRLNLPSHHPVREGMLSCTDCHSAHEDRRTTLGQANALCADCHQDHMGPWIYEHGPAVEDCTTCHNPHGTAAYNLLDTSQPALCLSCHSVPDNRHFTPSGEPGLTTISTDYPTGTSAITALAGAAFYTRCTDCHGAIHGSYRDKHLRR